MTTISKLGVRNIRSFGPDLVEIRFFRPLTVIVCPSRPTHTPKVGANGTGKTTIIESLKCANLAPPLSPESLAGQAFVHDPKVANSADVKAQVKLQFTNESGRLMALVRNMQLTRTRSRAGVQKMQFKSLESHIAYKDDSGVVKRASQRCTDFDKQIPELLGVSKAVLENVIFCHQEDSNWPLGDPATLKKKFDEIFASSRYTQALDRLKKYRSELTTELRVLKERLNAAASEHDSAVALRRDLTVSEAKVSDSLQECDAIQKHLRVAEREFTRLEALCRQVADLNRQIETKEDSLKSLKRISFQLENQLEEVDDRSDAELIKAEAAFMAQVSRCERESSKAKEDVARLEGEIGREMNGQIALIGEKAQWSESMSSLKAKVVSRDALLVDLCKSIELACTAAPFTNEDVEALLKQLNAKLATAKKAFDEMKRIGHENDEKDLAKLTKCEVDMRSCQEQTKTKTSEVLKLKKKIDAIEKRSQSVGGDELSQLKDALHLAEQDLERASQTFDPKAAEEAINVRTREHSEIQKASRLMEKQISQSNQKSTLVVQLKKTLEKKELDKSKLLDKRSKDLAAIIPSLDPSLIEDSVHREQKNCTEQVSRLQSSLVSLKEEFSNLKGQLSGNEQTLKKVQKRFDESQAGLSEADFCEDDDFLSVFSSLQEAFEHLQQESIEMESASALYKKFGDSASFADKCPLCERSFDAGCSIDHFHTIVETAISDIPSKQSQLVARIRETKDNLDTLEKLKPLWSQFEQSKAELPSLKREGNRLKQEMSQIESQMMDIQAQYDQAKSAEKMARSLTKDATAITRLHRECLSISSEITSHETELDKLGIRSDVAQLKKDASDSNQRRDFLAEEIEQMRGELQKNQKNFHLLDRKAGQLRESVMKMEAKQKSLLDDLMQLDELRANLKLLNDSIKGLADQLSQLSEVKKKKSQVRETRRRQQRVQEDEDEREVALLERQIDQIASQNDAIKQMDVKKIEREQMRLVRSVEQSESKVAGLKKQLAQQQKHHSESERMVIGQNQMHRVLQDHIRSREAKKVQEAAQGELDSLRSQLSLIEDASTCLSKKGAIHRSITEMEKNLAGKRGRLEVYEQQKANLQKELASDKFKGIDERHMKISVQKRTTEMAIKDLESYSKALDKALMKYHFLKMSEINTIIRDLWQNTYRGNDIDVIELRSDVEDEASVASSGKRSYNYRLVMVKGDSNPPIDLDMRGRCSAGQKVLASLIIRLALAEAFGLNCGVLALDEPTTNLDQANVEGFSNSLREIVQRRRQQANFQLILITHDESFIRLLGHDVAEQFYRVSKGEDGTSEISRHMIAELDA